MNDVAPTVICAYCQRLVQSRGGPLPRYCPICGRPLNTGQSASAGPAPDAERAPLPGQIHELVAPAVNAVATISLVCGVLGLVPVCGLPLAVIALATSAWARQQIARLPRNVGRRGLATAGLVLGSVGVGVTLFVCAGRAL